MTTSFWTDEKVAILQEMHGQGCKPAEIAQALGVTCKAVYGKLRRLALPLRRSARSYVRKAPPAPKDDLPGVSVIDARYGQCRWPISPDRAPYRFCGRPAVAPHSWCSEHAKKVYREPPSEYSAKAAATIQAPALADDTADSERQTLGISQSDSRDRDLNPPFDDAPADEGVEWIQSSG